MKLIKLSEEHYIVVDDSEIKEGDWYYDTNDKESLMPIYQRSQDPKFYSGCKKITHSTQSESLGMGWMQSVQPIFLSEVKELLGVVDVEKRAEEKIPNLPYKNYVKIGFIGGYNLALEDNKEKKYTEEDLRKAIDMARDIKDNSAHDVFTVEDISGCTEVCTYDWRNRYKDEEIIESLQPKTEWEVEFIDGMLKLKQ